MTLVLARYQPYQVGTTAGVEHVNRNTPTNWVKRFNAEGSEGLYDHPRCGRPPKMSHDRIDKILASPPSAEGLEKEAWTPKMLWHALKDNHGVLYSKGHLSDIVKKLNYRSIVPRTQSIAANPDK